MTSIMSPVNSLLSAIFLKFKEMIIFIFTSASYYKVLNDTYYKEGLFSLFHKLAIIIYYETSCYIKNSWYYILGFQCLCIYQVYLGYDLALIILLFYMIMHLPFFIISIAMHITIINRNFYKKHPILFTLYIGACILLFFILIVLFIKLYGLISHLIDDYFVQAKGDNGGNSGGQGPGSKPGSGPGSGPSGGDPKPSDIYPDTTNKKATNKKVTLTEDQKKEKYRLASASYREKLKNDTTVDEHGLTALDKSRAKARVRQRRFRKTPKGKVQQAKQILSRPSRYQ